ncbi:MAG: hypothetical protein H0U61_12520 [Nocardioidaceae bacterium]|nr:hypothetical protein [Nocardioidaceae bacterium]
MSISSSSQSPPAGEGPPADPVGAYLAELDEVLDKAAVAQVWSLDDARVQRRLGAVLAVRARVDELVSRLVGEVDDRDLGRAGGASSTKAHLVGSYRLSGGAAAGLLTRPGR